MKLNKIILSAVTALSFAGCQSDMEFLTEKPKDRITIENAFETSDQLLATIVSAYASFESFYFAGGMGSDNFTYRQAGTDILDCKTSVTHYSNFDQWTTTSGFVKSIWDGYYRVISYANLAISQLDNVSWSNEADKVRLEGEAHFLRGLAHLRLAEYYGAVPIIREFIQETKFDYVRDPRADVYNFAIEEFKLAYAALPESTIAMGQAGRASKYVAAHYLAEALVALGTETDDKACFTDAEKYAKEVIAKHPLMTGRFGMRAPGATGSRNGIPNEFLAGSAYSDLFVSQNMTLTSNTESMWVAQAAPDYTTFSANGNNGNRSITLSLTPALQDYAELQGYPADLGYGKPFSENVPMEIGMYPYIHGGQGWAQNTITWYATYEMWNAENNFGGTDDRYEEDVTVRTKYMVTNQKHPLYGQEVGWEYIPRGMVNEASMFGALFYKETPLDRWDWDEVNDTYSWFFPIARGTYYRSKYMLRSAETYLILAEAQLRGGNSSSALETLNTLRARANANPASNIDVQVVLDERGRELLLEEDRWGTLLRCKPEEWQSRIENYGTYTARGTAAKFPDIRRWSEYTKEIQFENWPIPQTYIDLNTGAEMAQNVGW